MSAIFACGVMLVTAVTAFVDAVDRVYRDDAARESELEAVDL